MFERANAELIWESRKNYLAEKTLTFVTMVQDIWVMRNEQHSNDRAAQIWSACPESTAVIIASDHFRPVGNGVGTPRERGEHLRLDPQRERFDRHEAGPAWRGWRRWRTTTCCWQLFNLDLVLYLVVPRSWKYLSMDSNLGLIFRTDDFLAVRTIFWANLISTFSEF